MDSSIGILHHGVSHHPFLEEDSVAGAARNGDNAAFSVLATKYRRRILNIVRHITGSFEDAEDVTQEALLKAYLNIGGFRGTCSFSTWLTRIAINEALMWKRRPARRAEVSWSSGSDSDELGLALEVADKRPNPEQCYRSREQVNIVLAALKRLKPAVRQALEVCDLNEGSMDELALVQGTSLSTAKSRLFRGRMRVRARLKRLLHHDASE